MNSIHLETPLSINQSRYSTRRNLVGLLDFIPELEKVYQKRASKLASRRILENLGSESLLDIHFHFEESSKINNIATSDVYFKPLDFTQIAYQPHTLPNKAIEKLLTFQENNVVNTEVHLGKISKSFLVGLEILHKHMIMSI